MQYCLELNKTGKNGVLLFFERMHSAENTYRDSFQTELDEMQLRFRAKAKEKLDKMIEDAREKKLAEFETQRAKENKILMIILAVACAVIAVCVAYLYATLR